VQCLPRRPEPSSRRRTRVARESLWSAWCRILLYVYVYLVGVGGLSNQGIFSLLERDKMLCQRICKQMQWCRMRTRRMLAKVANKRASRKNQGGGWACASSNCLVQRSRPPFPQPRSIALQIKLYLPIQPQTGKPNGVAGGAPPAEQSIATVPPVEYGDVDIIATGIYCRTA
jgi:hypothetical protein